MPLPDPILLTSFTVRRPFGTDAAPAGSYRGHLTPAAGPGRSPSGNNPRWTHTLDVNMDADVRDGCTRAAGANELTYADGDEIRVVGGGVFVVVWVETHNAGTPAAFKRAYLMRHAA